MADDNKKISEAEAASAPETATEAAPEATPETAPAGKKKSRLRRILKWIFLPIGILLIVVILALLFVRDFVIEHSVEQIGTLIVGTPVRIGYIDTSLFKGTLHLKDFTVGNPPGFNHPNAIELAEIKVELNTKSLFTDKIEVVDVLVRGVNIDYELQLGKSNLGEIQRNVEKATGADDESSSPSPEKSSDDGEPAQEKQAVIRHLLVTDCSLSFSNATLGTTMKMPLPGLDLKDLGDGKPISETVNDLFGLIFTSISKAIGGIGGALSDTAKSFSDTFRSLLPQGKTAK